MEVHPKVDLISRTVIVAAGDMFHFCLIFMQLVCFLVAGCLRKVPINLGHECHMNGLERPRFSGASKRLGCRLRGVALGLD